MTDGDGTTSSSMSHGDIPKQRRGSNNGNLSYDSLIEKVSKCLQRFDLVDVSASERIIVAVSGGKDSLLLARCLVDLGIDVLPIVIDMGYEAGWAHQIKSLARMIDIEPEVISARTQGNRQRVVELEIGRRIEILDAIPASNKLDTATPCTHCYSVKALALQEAARVAGVSKVAFAHHMTDAMASLIKEGLMHIDHFRHGHKHYVRRNFKDLVVQLVDESRQLGDEFREGSIARAIEDRVDQALIDTDEPPRQPLVSGVKGFEIVRPLFMVDEFHITSVARSSNIQTAGSGCGHGAVIETQTPRELVHHQLLSGDVTSAPHYQYLRNLVFRSIATDGTGRVRARQRRSELLGVSYKPSTDELEKL